MEEQDKWMKGLRSKLQHHSEPIPAGLWEQLEQELQTDAVDSLPKTIPMWRRWQSVAAVVAMVILSTTTLLFWEYTSDDTFQQADLMEYNHLVDQEKVTQEVAQREGCETETIPSSMPAVEEKRVSATDKQPNSVAMAYASVLKSNDLANDALNIAEIAAQEENGVTTVAEEAIDWVADEAKTADKAATEVMDHSTNKVRKKDFFTTAVVQKSKKNERKTTLALAMGNMPTTSAEAYGGYKRLQIDGLTGIAFNSPMADGQSGLLASYKEGTKESALSAVVLNNIARNEIFTDVKHHAPLTFGASVRFQLSKHWGIETGLTYTLLQSDLRGGSSDSYYEEEQRLHYLGIPLRATRTIWGNRHFEVYASAGGAIEKSVSGKLKSTYIVDNSEEITHVESLNIKEVQFSLAATVGAQYKVSQQMGFYVEPGMVYYFNDGSNVETIRKEHPYNFNLQLGFRLDF